MPAPRRPRTDGMEALFEAARGIPVESRAGLAGTEVVEVPRAALRNFLLRVEMLKRTRDLNAVCSRCRRTMEGRSHWNPDNHANTCEFMQLAFRAGLRHHSDARAEVGIYAPYMPLYVSPASEEGALPRADLQAPVPVTRPAEIVPSREGEDE